jgi:hypothetical protein
MTLSLQDFTDNFTVTTVHFDNSTTNVSVHFKVHCRPNNRISIHTKSVDTTQLQQGYTSQDVIAEAWNAVKNVVNTWAEFNLSQDRLTELTVTSTSNAIDVNTFNTHFLVKIIRFDLVPQVNPTDWCIGFSLCIRDNESMSQNFEGLISLTQEYCNNTLCTDIANAAWDLVKNNASDWAASKLPNHDILNIIFVPTNI